MSNIVLTGDTSGAITVAAPAVAGTNTLTLPATTGTLATTTDVNAVVEAIGVDQSYTDVTSSRAYNTEYTNSTGKPIFVYTVWTVGTGADIKFFIGGVTQVGALYTNASNGRGSMSFIVPNGLTYKCDGGGTATLQGWFELR